MGMLVTAGVFAGFLVGRLSSNRAHPSTSEPSGDPNGDTSGGGNSIPRGRAAAAPPVETGGVLARGRVAVVIGSAGGIGRAVVLACVARGMKVVIADLDEAEAELVKAECVAAGAAESDVLVVGVDVRRAESLLALKDQVWATFGGCHFLMNNAGIQTNGQCGAFGHPDRWQRILETNLLGVYHGGLAFVDAMVAQDEPCIVVNTGSKQGITAPPGDTAYNVSKAGVKALTEAMQHELRTAGAKVNAFLLVPGFTATQIVSRGQQWLQGDKFDPATARNDKTYDGVDSREHAVAKWKARGAYSSEEVASELFAALDAGTPFYIILQDHETTLAEDQGRMQWAFDDVLFRRAPLSRWSKEYKSEYKQVSSKF